MTTITETKYSFPAARLAEVQAVVDRLAKKAARIGVHPVSLAVDAELDVPLRVDGDGLALTPWTEADGPLAELDAAGLIRYERVVEVTIRGEAPAAAGWEFVATLQHVDGEDGQRLTVLRVVPGHEGRLPERFRTATPETCDHCGYRRQRKDTYVVRRVADSVPTGTYLQVGSTCLRDFFGGEDPMRAVARLDMLLAACDAAAGAGDVGGGYGGDRWSLRVVLATTAALVRVDGWVSRTKAREAEERGECGVQATADAVRYYLCPPRGCGSLAVRDWERFVGARPVTDADRALAAAALDYARGDLADRDDLSDYEHNLRVACAVASVDRRLLGIACSLVAHYQREVERRVRREADAARTAASRCLAAPKDRILLRVALARVVPTGLDSPWGPSYLHKFVTVGTPGTADEVGGSAVAWFASDKMVVPSAGPLAGTLDAMTEGRTYWLKGTVKAHGEYRGVAETTLTRAVVLTDEQAAVEVAKPGSSSRARGAAGRRTCRTRDAGDRGGPDAQ